MDSLVGLTRGPDRKECTGVLIVVTSYPYAPHPRIQQPEEDDDWISSWSQSSSSGPFKGHTNISKRTANRCITIKHYVIKVCQWLATGRWLSLGPSVSLTDGLFIIIIQDNGFYLTFCTFSFKFKESSLIQDVVSPHCVDKRMAQLCRRHSPSNNSVVTSCTNCSLPTFFPLDVDFLGAVWVAFFHLCNNSNVIQRYKKINA
jgi:hypothetical protein